MLLSVFIAAVISVSDGDTLTVLHDRQPVEVRLAEIDAPEETQAFGARAKQSLSEMCFGKQAEVSPHARDRYGRTIAHVRCGGINASAEQIRRGMAWVYDKYITDQGLYGLQDEARAARRGLWSDPAPVPPWQWRRKWRRTTPTKLFPNPRAEPRGNGLD